MHKYNKLIISHSDKKFNISKSISPILNIKKESTLGEILRQNATNICTSASNAPIFHSAQQWKF